MKTRLFLILSGFLTLSSCTTTLYMSNGVNCPLLKEQGEVKITGDQTDLQVAVGVTRHIGVMANGFCKLYQGERAFNYKHDGRFGELGVGYFNPFKNGLVFETYAGAGIGLVRERNIYAGSDGLNHGQGFESQLSRLFVQPGIGYCSQFFELAFTPRFSYVNYMNFESYGYSEEELAVNYLDHFHLIKQPYLFAEPALTLRAGYRFVKVQLQYGLTLDLGPQQIKHSTYFGNIGVVIDFAKWYRKRPNAE
jgi:hypothetical protein